MSPVLTNLLWRAFAAGVAIVTLWQLSPEWRAVLRAQWITGEDGRPAFWKIAHIGNAALLIAVCYWCHVEGTLTSCLGWLFAWSVLSLYASQGLKGLALYKDAKADAKVTAQLTATSVIDPTKLAEIIAQRRHPRGFGGDQPDPPTGAQAP